MPSPDEHENTYSVPALNGYDLEHEISREPTDEFEEAQHLCDMREDYEDNLDS